MVSIVVAMFCGAIRARVYRRNGSKERSGCACHGNENFKSSGIFVSLCFESKLGLLCLINGEICGR